ncbi:MAG: TetR/AcrR family transcriptional regulator, partial [Actinobacteria bacterium]|nr:TetR/AcrR family transcriptional regulator [Actinomycetota bacterium]
MTRVTKKPEERKNEIMNAAEELFITKGFDFSAVSDVVKKVGVSQGVFYYYFKSKVEVLDVIMERYVDNLAEKVKAIAKNERLNAQQKLQAIIDVAFGFEIGKENKIEYLYKEKNPVIYQQIMIKVINQFVPLLTEVISQGVEEGIFDTPFPREATEILLGGMTYQYDAIGVFPQSMDIYYKKAKAMEDIVERVIGAKK